MRDYYEMTPKEIQEETKAERLAELNQFAEEGIKICVVDMMKANGKHLMDVISCYNFISIQKTDVEGYMYLVSGMVPFQPSPYYTNLEEILDDFVAMEEEPNIELSVEFDISLSKEQIDNYKLLIQDWEITRNWREDVLLDRPID